MKCFVFLLFFSCSLESTTSLENDISASSSTGYENNSSGSPAVTETPAIDALPTYEPIITETPGANPLSGTENVEPSSL
mgnify:CR=1 FL=1